MAFQLWAAAHQKLGLTKKEFWWGLTCAEIDYLFDAHTEEQKILDYRAGIVAAPLWSLAHPGHGFQWMDFFSYTVSESRACASTESLIGTLRALCVKPLS